MSCDTFVISGSCSCKLGSAVWSLQKLLLHKVFVCSCTRRAACLTFSHHRRDVCFLILSPNETALLPPLHCSPPHHMDPTEKSPAQAESFRHLVIFLRFAECADEDKMFVPFTFFTPNAITVREPPISSFPSVI